MDALRSLLIRKSHRAADLGQDKHHRPAGFTKPLS